MAVDEFGREVPVPSAPPRYHHHPPPNRHNSRDRDRDRDRDRHHRSGVGGGVVPPYSPPSSAFLSRPLSATRYGGERERERDHRGPLPTPHAPPPSKSSHPSKLYQDEPLMCEYLWKQKRHQQTSKENENENEHDVNNNDDYPAYRKTYCLRFIQSFLNQHLDHSWFRDRYSPSCRRRVLLQENARAGQEAHALASDVKQPDFWSQVQLLGTVEAKVRGDLPVPQGHLLSTDAASLYITDIPPHVVDEQIETALLNLLENEDDASGAFKIYCTDPRTAVTRDSSNRNKFASSSYHHPSPDASAAFFLYRDAIVTCRNEALHQRVLSRLVESSSSTSTTNAQAGLIPRKEGDLVLSKSTKMYVLEVDCSDPYGRVEVDAGKGAAPADGQSIPLEKVLLTVRSSVPLPKIHVLTSALSAQSRIASDKEAAIVIARALDAAKKLTAHKLDDIIESLQASPSTSSLMDEQILDLAVAYLRRVHLFCFYTCTPASNLAEFLVGKNSSKQATIHVRMKDEAEASVEAAEPGSVNKADDSVTEDNENNNNNKDKNENLQAQENHADDLLVQRRDQQIASMLEMCPKWISGEVDSEVNSDSDSLVSSSRVVVAGVGSELTNRQADEIAEQEQAVVETWLNDHAIIDDDNRARCSFHFCHKLFKDTVFLHKHLLKKHAEFLRAEQAKCHDSYVMAEWEQCPARPLCEILVDCGANFGLVPTSLLPQAEPDCVDPEPALWQKEEEKRKAQEEQRLRREEMRQQQQNQYRETAGGGAGGGAVSRGFIDVDDMKEEKVELSFDNVPVPTAAIKKKKKKRKLL